MKISLLVFLIFCLVACSKTENRVVAQGGQDSGGGNIVFSTNKDIEASYKNAMEDLPHIVGVLLNEAFIESVLNEEKIYLLSAFKNKLENVALKDSNVNRTEKTTSEEEGYHVDAYQDEEYVKVHKSFSKVMLASKVEIKEEAPCVSVDKPHAYASIKEFKVGSPICLSFFKLRQVPKDSLYKEILGVLLHEYLHALSFSEKNVILIQTIVTNNFSVLSRAYVYNRIGALERASGLVELKEFNNSIKIYSLFDGELSVEEKNEFCDLLSLVPLKIQPLYKKYSEMLDENRGPLLEKNVITHKMWNDLNSSLSHIILGHLLDLKSSPLAIMKNSCKGSANITIDYRVRAGLLRLSENTLLALDAMDEIDFYLSRIY